MKKFLLFTALAAMAFTANAGVETADKRPDDADVVNKLVNGSFDDPNFEEDGEHYTWFETPPVGIAVLPGWELGTSGEWNGIVQLLEQEPDDYLVFEGNKYLMRIRHYEENGWTAVNVYQTMKNLTVGTTYTIDFITGHAFPDAWSGPKQGIQVMEYIEGENALQGFEVLKEESEGGEGLTEEAFFDYYVTKFTATKEQMTLRLYSGVWNYEGNHVDTHWTNWDEVRVYDPNEESGIANVAVDTEAPVMIFNLQGVLMPAGAELNGVYIKKQGNQVSKVIY